MKTLLLAVSLVFSFGAFAQDLSNGINGKGQIQLYCVGNWAPEANTRIEVSQWGEGKIKVILTIGATLVRYKSEAIDETQATSLHYIGLDNGFGSYDLFDKANGMQTPVGELALSKYSGSMKFSRTLPRIILGNQNRTEFKPMCSIYESTSIRFQTVEPKCLNKRGKEIKCPKIEL